MRHHFIAVLSAIFGLCVSGSAGAAVSVYTASGIPPYDGFPPAINTSESLGVPDGVGADVPVGGFIAFEDSDPFTLIDHDVEFLGVTGAGLVRFYVGLTNGAGGFTTLNSAFFTVPPGTTSFTFTSPGLSTFCAGLGGCNTFVLQAWTGTTFSLDSAIAHSPEPGAWALMISGFVMVSWRLKHLRRGSPSVGRPQFAR